MPRHRPVVIPADLRPVHWRDPATGARGEFRANAPLDTFTTVHGYAPNPPVMKWRDPGGKTLAARLIVGFNVKGKPTWSVDDLVQIVRAVRTRQHQKPDASFLVQRGIYTGDDRKVVTEDGAQAVIFNFTKSSERAFINQMIQLADTIADQLKQETVILEIQRGGIIEESMGVGHKRKK